MIDHKRLRKRGKKRGKYLKESRRCPKPCGIVFRPRIRTQVHCSAKCRNRAAQMAFRRRQRARKAKAA